jgi:alpha-D-ribose 1-methylphosphonate 5-triphosphate synthase subunit PhnG
VQLESGEIGHSYRLGTDREAAHAAACLDALWQTDMRQRVINEAIAPIMARITADDRRCAEETAATKVNFFTMVRGED